MDQQSHTSSPMGRLADPGDHGPRPGRHGLRRHAPPSASLCLSCPREGSRWPPLPSPRHRERETAQAELEKKRQRRGVLMTTLASILTIRLAVIQTGTATTGSSNSFFTFVQVGFGCLVVLLVLFWLSLVIWTVRDIRARPHERVPRILAPVVVAVFFLGGWLIYRLLRPRHRQAEPSAQELEETTLLAGMATLQVCPTCPTRVELDFLVFPWRHQELKRPCPRFGRLLELIWMCWPD